MKIKILLAVCLVALFTINSVIGQTTVITNTWSRYSIPKWTSKTSALLGDSQISDNGTNVFIGAVLSTPTTPSFFNVYGTSFFSNTMNIDGGVFRMTNNASTNPDMYVSRSGNSNTPTLNFIQNYTDNEGLALTSNFILKQNKSNVLFQINNPYEDALPATELSIESGFVRIPNRLLIGNPSYLTTDKFAVGGSSSFNGDMNVAGNAKFISTNNDKVWINEPSPNNYTNFYVGQENSWAHLAGMVRFKNYLADINFAYKSAQINGVSHDFGLNITIDNSVFSYPSVAGLWIDVPGNANAAIFNTGKVGIGNSTPTGLLDVKGSNTPNALKFKISDTDNRRMEFVTHFGELYGYGHYPNSSSTSVNHMFNSNDMGIIFSDNEGYNGDPNANNDGGFVIAPQYSETDQDFYWGIKIGPYDGVYLSTLWAYDVNTSIKNAGTINNALNTVKQMNGVTHDYSEKEAKFYGVTKNNGFNAAELKKVLPEVVKEDNGNLFINYNGIIPLLTEAIKEQQTIIEDQNTKIDALQQELETIKSALVDSKLITPNSSSLTEIASLMQNQPNPFSQNTLIKCFVPKNANDASIIVFNMNGNTLKSYKITGKGECSVTISANEFSEGMYMYSLIIDGKEIATKKMILTK